MCKEDMDICVVEDGLTQCDKHRSLTIYHENIISFYRE